MPDKILIDNFHHGFAQIHPDRKEIKTRNQKEAMKIVLKYITKNKGVIYDKLREKLIK
jgi:hypothetical protein